MGAGGGGAKNRSPPPYYVLNQNKNIYAVQNQNKQSVL